MENPQRPPVEPPGPNGNGSRSAARRPNNTLAVFILLVGLAMLFLWFFRTGDQSLKINANFFYEQLRKKDKVTIGKPGEEVEYHSVAELKAALDADKISKEQLAAKRQELTNIKSVKIHDWQMTGE